MCGFWVSFKKNAAVSIVSIHPRSFRARRRSRPARPAAALTTTTPAYDNAVEPRIPSHSTLTVVDPMHPIPDTPKAHGRLVSSLVGLNSTPTSLSSPVSNPRASDTPQPAKSPRSKISTDLCVVVVDASDRSIDFSIN